MHVLWTTCANTMKKLILYFVTTLLCSNMCLKHYAFWKKMELYIEMSNVSACIVCYTVTVMIKLSVYLHIQLPTFWCNKSVLVQAPYDANALVMVKCYTCWVIWTCYAWKMIHQQRATPLKCGMKWSNEIQQEQWVWNHQRFVCTLLELHWCNILLIFQYPVKLKLF